MNHLDQLEKDLTCPITLDLFDDPITAPCCKKAFSRAALVEYLSIGHKCPLCNADLSLFDIGSAPRELQLVGLLDTFIKLKDQNNNNHIILEQQKNHSWSCKIYPLSLNGIIKIAEFELIVNQSNFKIKPNLFILVVDRSGSMGGSPWRQVEIALKHILILAKSNSCIKTAVIAYDSTAEIINMPNDEDEMMRTIKYMYTGGGTNFNAAFEKIGRVLQQQTSQPEAIGDVNVIFLTDGESGDNRQKLISNFKEILRNNWKSNICVHSVGFGVNCDKVLLEGIRLCGTNEGIFRYTDTNSDQTDALCNKLTSLFDALSKSSTTEIQLELINGCFKNETKNCSTKININGQQGIVKNWISWNELCPYEKIIVNSSIDKNIEVACDIVYEHQRHEELFEKLLFQHIDVIAEEILELSKNNLDFDNKNLLVALVQQKINKIRFSTMNNEIVEKITYLENELKSIKRGLNINVGTMSDMRFTSIFSGIESKPISIANTNQANSISLNVPTSNTITQNQNFVEKNIDKSTFFMGNELQMSIESNRRKYSSHKVTQLLAVISENNIMETNEHGNNALHFAAYVGQLETVKIILNKFPNIDLQVKNCDGETPLTVAIKRGFWNTAECLADAGSLIPDNRKHSLIQYIKRTHYSNTLTRLENMDDSSPYLNMNMTEEYIMKKYKTGKELDIPNYLDVAMAKCMVNLVKDLIELHNAKPSFQQLVKYCFPPKPDHLETEKYLELTKLIISHNKNFLKILESEGNNLLIIAVEKGSLPHVKYYLTEGISVDTPNNLGNTALWIACWKLYPCIISELLIWGADINYQNLKGNPPLSCICQRGSIKICELLLANGAIVNIANKNGDTMIHLCCRNGQHEILKMLVQLVDTESLDFKATVDGFSPVMAAAEANKPECIRILSDNGANLEQRTDETNSILPLATALHIAVYYSKLEAIKSLLLVGVNVNSLDINNRTPLHVACIKNDIEVIKILLNYKPSLQSMDTFGNIPLSYCQNSEDIKDLLSDPATEILFKLARGEFNNEKYAAEIINTHMGLFGCLDKKECIDLMGCLGKIPLMEAVIHSNYNIVKLFLEMGSDPLLKNIHGINSIIWSEITGNIKIKKLFEHYNENVSFYVENLKKYIKNDNRALMYIGIKPSNKILANNIITSTIGSRMETYLNYVFEDNLKMLEYETNILSKIIQLDIFAELFETSIFWKSKIFALSIAASGSLHESLTINNVLALTLYTSNALFSKILNDNIVTNQNNNATPYIKYMNDILISLPSFDGEVYIGTDKIIDRHKYLVGKEFIWKTFNSGSTLWSVAVNNAKSFQTIKQGTIFIVKSKTAKYIGQYSEYTGDAEIIILPNTNFIVTNWYHGDIIALGQANIRQRSYQINEDNMEKMINSNKALIIELTEIIYDLWN